MSIIDVELHDDHTTSANKSYRLTVAKLPRETMLQVRFKDADGCYVFGDELEFQDLSGGSLIVHRNNTEFQCLSALLGQTAGKLKAITIGGISEASPEYLAFLNAACRKADSVQIMCCVMGDAVYECLQSSIVNPDGIQELSIKLRGQRMSAQQAYCLFQGVASSSSLQKFQMMWPDFEDMEDSFTALENAFIKNQSLKSASLYLRTMPTDSVLKSVLRAATGNKSLEHLHITVQHEKHGVRNLSLSFLQECLCQKTCSIQRLRLRGMVMDGDLGDDNIQRHNSVLTDVSLPLRANLTCAQAVKFAKSFSSLRYFLLNIDPFSELAPLDEILLGEDATLEDLTLMAGPESGMVDHWAEFFQKLPRMKSLKSLDFPRWVFQSESCRSAFLDAIQRNKTISKIIPSTFGCVEAEDEPYFVDLHWKMSHLLSLNRGGRHFLQKGQPISRNLWPHVLERAMGIKYASSYEITKHPQLGSLENDVVYWLLRENLLTS